MVIAIPFLLVGLGATARAHASDCEAARRAERLPVVPFKARLKVESASASSTMPRWKGYNFEAKNLLDGELATSWQPAGSTSGRVGEWIVLRFARPTVVRALAIGNGFQRNDTLGDLFLANSRAKELCVELSEGAVMRLELPGEERGLIHFELGPVKTELLKLKVRAIHRGEKWNDLAISELIVYGDDSAPTEATAAVAPASADASPLLLEVRESLLSGDATRANRLAQELAKTNPDVRALWEVQAAYAELNGQVPSGSVVEALERLPAPQPPGASVPPPRVGESAFVAATAVRLRESADSRSRLKAELSINTQVKVRAVKGDWASVETSVEETPRVIDWGADVTKTAKGFLPWRSLSAAPSSAEQLEAQAEAMSSSGKLLEASLLMERAVSLDPADQARARRAVHLALEAKQFGLATRLVHSRLNTGQGERQTLKAAISILWACRGDVERAGILGDATHFRGLPRNACVTDVDPVGPCPPMSPEMGCGYSGSDCVQELRKHQADLRAYEDIQVASFQTHLAALSELFPSAPYAKIAAFNQLSWGSKLFVYWVEFSRDICTDSVTTLKNDTLQVAAAWRGSNGESFWVPLPKRYDGIVGVMAAGSSDEARHLLETAIEASTQRQYDPEKSLPGTNVVLPSSGCECGGTRPGAAGW